MKTFDSGYVAIPNMFTPNFDGINDVLQIYTKGITDYHVVIKNGWGTTYFESNDPQDRWDGTNQNKKTRKGVFNLTIEVTTKGGASIKIENEICVTEHDPNPRDDVCMEFCENCAPPGTFNDTTKVFRSNLRDITVDCCD